MSSPNTIIASGTALIICPKISNHFGDSAALVLQQLHYWISKENLNYGIFENNRQWIRNSYAQWQKQIMVRSVSSIKIAFSQLIEQGVVQAKNFSSGNRYAGGDQVKYYTIDYTKLISIVGKIINVPSHFGQKDDDTNKRSVNEKPQATCSVIKNSFNSMAKNKEPSQKKQPIGGGSEINREGVRNKHPFTKTTSKITHFSQKESPLVEANRAENKDFLISDAKSVVFQGEEEKLISKSFSQKICKESKPSIKTPATPHKETNPAKMINLWIELIEKGKPIALTDNRSRNLTAAFKQYFDNDLNQWESFCLKIASSKFLMGEVTTFKASLDWVLKFDTLQRILEGGYTFGDRFVERTSCHVSLLNQNMGEGIQKEATQTTISNKNSILSLNDGLLSPEEITLRLSIRKEIGDALYVSWFKGARIVMPETTFYKKKSAIRDVTEGAVWHSFQDRDEAGDTLPLLVVSNDFLKQRMKNQFRDLVERCFADVLREGETVSNSKFMQKPSDMREPKMIHNTLCFMDIPCVSQPSFMP